MQKPMSVVGGSGASVMPEISYRERVMGANNHLDSIISGINSFYDRLDSIAAQTLPANPVGPRSMGDELTILETNLRTLELHVAALAKIA